MISLKTENLTTRRNIWSDQKDLIGIEYGLCNEQYRGLAMQKCKITISSLQGDEIQSKKQYCSTCPTNKWKIQIFMDLIWSPLKPSLIDKHSNIAFEET